MADNDAVLSQENRNKTKQKAWIKELYKAPHDTPGGKALSLSPMYRRLKDEANSRDIKVNTLPSLPNDSGVAFANNNQVFVTNKARRLPKEVPTWLRPVVGGTPPEYALAHELGHVGMHRGLGRIVQNPIGNVMGATAFGLAHGVQQGLADTENPGTRAALYSAITSMPELLSEAGASIKGHALLKAQKATPLQMSQYRGHLGVAYGTYLAGAGMKAGLAALTAKGVRGVRDGVKRFAERNNPASIDLAQTTKEATMTDDFDNHMKHDPDHDLSRSYAFDVLGGAHPAGGAMVGYARRGSAGVIPGALGSFGGRALGSALARSIGFTGNSHGVMQVGGGALGTRLFTGPGPSDDDLRKQLLRLGYSEKEIDELNAADAPDTRAKQASLRVYRFYRLA